MGDSFILQGGRAGKGNRKASAAAVLVQDDEKILEFLTLS